MDWEILADEARRDEAAAVALLKAVWSALRKLNVPHELRVRTIIGVHRAMTARAAGRSFVGEGPDSFLAMIQSVLLQERRLWLLAQLTPPPKPTPEQLAEREGRAQRIREHVELRRRRTPTPVAVSVADPASRRGPLARMRRWWLRRLRAFGA